MKSQTFSRRRWFGLGMPDRTCFVASAPNEKRSDLRLCASSSVWRSLTESEMRAVLG